MKVEAKLVYGLQGTVKHPTPAFCPGPAGDLCLGFFIWQLLGSNNLLHHGLFEQFHSLRSGPVSFGIGVIPGPAGSGCKFFRALWLQGM